MLIVLKCPRRSMDRIWVCGTHDAGSIPAEGTNKKKTHSHSRVAGCFLLAVFETGVKSTTETFLISPPHCKHHYSARLYIFL